MTDEIDTSAEAVERQGLIPRHTKLLLRALAAERDAERQRAEKAEAAADAANRSLMVEISDVEYWRKRAEQAEAERDRLRQAAHFVHGLPPGEWETWDSCSFRRISSRGSCRDGDVLHAIVQRSDGHPDLSWDEETCWALCHLVNGLRAALRQDEG